MGYSDSRVVSILSDQCATVVLLYSPFASSTMSLAIPLQFVTADDLQQQPEAVKAWAIANRFKAEAGTYCLIPALAVNSADGEGAIAAVLVGKPDVFDTWTLGSLANALPPHTYSLPQDLAAAIATQLCLGWQLSQYRFDQYRKPSQHRKTGRSQPELVVPNRVDQTYLKAAVNATTLVRNLVNTPVNDMGPAQLEAAADSLATEHQALITVTVGQELLAQNYPMIHAVGRASDQPPRLIDIRWGELGAPKVTLVGKGVCFDSGGLNIKSANGMKLMKKDMGGAAQVLGLAHFIMAMKLSVRLRVLIPAVENSISSGAMRPSDILASRKGITVEIGNTDAEGRLVLADALWEATQENPDLLIDCATLTGAARVALGTELPAFFCNNEAIAQKLIASGLVQNDALWQLPLHMPYREMLASKIADINNISSGSYGGAITAALFLQEFVKPNVPWIHIDFMAWNLRSLPGRPEGGEAMGMRALFGLIQQHLSH